MKDFLLLILGYIVLMLTNIGVMINGWGIEPKSWWWIVGVSTIGYIVGGMATAAGGN